MKFGVALGALNAHFHGAAAEAAEALGYESVWIPEHLVLPIEMSRSPRPGEEHPPVAPGAAHPSPSTGSRASPRSWGLPRGGREQGGSE